MIGRGAPRPPAGDAGAWRLFVAVPLPPAVRDELAARTASLRTRRDAARWQSPDTWHLTLRFLGDVPARNVPAITAGMRRAARRIDPFPVELRGSGSFGGGHRGRVLWIGVGRGAAELAALANALSEALSPETAATEPGFRAHLTVAREADPSLPAALATALASGSDLTWLADRLVLYRSHLGPGGARHEECGTARLGTRAADGTISEDE